jgi:hypothetical protein
MIGAARVFLALACHCSASSGIKKLKKKNKLLITFRLKICVTYFLVAGFEPL